MGVDTFIKLIFSTIEFSSIVLLSFSLFRIPIKYSWKKIIAVSFIISLISIFQRDFAHLQDYAFITQVLCYVILISVFFQLPFFYSLLVCMTGYTAFAIIQTLLLGVTFQMITVKQLTSSILYFSAFQFIESILVYLLVFWMQVKKIGFMFVTHRFAFKQVIKGHHSILLGTIILGIITMQLNLLSIIDHDAHNYFLTVLIIVFIISLFVTYSKNKIEIEMKYERYKNKL